MGESIHDRIRYLVKEVANGKNTLFANRLGINEANVRGYIKDIMPKADVLERIVRTYDVDAMWLLTGIGEWRRASTNSSEASNITPDVLQIFGSYLQQKDEIITEQAEEIGRLKEQLRGFTTDASSVPNRHTANAV